jgi:hypothetical protein
MLYEIILLVRFTIPEPLVFKILQGLGRAGLWVASIKSQNGVLVTAS